MSKLSATQLVILSTACQRDDGSVFPITAKLTGGALNKVLTTLLHKGLLEEIATKAAEHVWRTEGDGARFILKATPAACEALGLEPTNEGRGAASEGEASGPSSTKIPGPASAGSPRGRKPRQAAQAAAGAARAEVAGTGPAKGSGGDVAPLRVDGDKSRAGTKQAALIAMLRQPDGASIDEIVAATGWQPHTVRGAIAGALKKKLGLTIGSEKIEGRWRVYRIEV
jgi:hypothetical protein